MAFILQYRQLRSHVLRLLQEAGADGEAASASYSDDTIKTPPFLNEKPKDESSQIGNTPLRHIPGVSVAEDCDGEQYFQVGWEQPTDPFNPQQWSTARRICSTLMVCMIALLTTMASSIDAAILTEASEEFGVAEVVESLATAMYLIGFGVGGLVSSPLSEMVGRYPVYLGTLAIFAGWLVGAALAPNIGAQIVFRFLAGVMGASPLTLAGGSISDIWNTLEKTFGFPMFAIPGFGGPILGMLCTYNSSSPFATPRLPFFIMKKLL